MCTETQPLVRSNGKLCTAETLAIGDRLLVYLETVTEPAIVESVTVTAIMADVTNLVIGDNCNIIAAGFVVRSKPPAE